MIFLLIMHYPTYILEYYYYLSLGVAAQLSCVRLESRVGGLQVLWILLCALTQWLYTIFRMYE